MRHQIPPPARNSEAVRETVSGTPSGARISPQSDGGELLQTEHERCKLQTGCKLEPSENNNLGQFAVCSPQSANCLCKLALSPGKPTTYDPNPVCTQTPSINTTRGGADAAPLRVSDQSFQPTRSAAPVVKRIAFTTDPPVGTVLMVEGQRYELVGINDHVRQDGQPTRVLLWQTHCPDCAAAFIATSPLKAKSINRRCPRHHKKGRPVAGSSRRRRGGRRG